MATAGHRAGSHQRDRNLALVLRALGSGGAASRSELAAELGFDRSTLTHLANSLLAAGLVVESTEQPAGSRGGRKRRPLRINPARYGVLGVDIGPHRAEWNLVRLDGTAVRSGLIGRDGDQTDEAAWVTYVLEALNGLPVNRRDLLGTGVSLPGLVDHRTSTLRHSVALGLSGFDLRTAGTSASLIADNDANCCLWNRVNKPGGLGTNLLCQVRLHRNGDCFLPSGAGIGLAISVGGSIHYGSTGSAGELRGYGWTARCTDQLGLSLDAVEREGGTGAALDAFAKALLINLSVVVSVIDPSRVIITGDTDTLGDHLMGALDRAPDTPIAQVHGAGRVEIAPRHAYPPASGAARMALARILEAGAGVDNLAGADVGWQIIAQRCA